MKVEVKQPTCLGFIMDGNRRWAREQNRPTLNGHSKGKEVFEACVRWLRDRSIPHGVFYVFSTENWGRTQPEVQYLMELFSTLLVTLREQLEKEQVRFRFVGRREDFSAELQQRMRELEERSAQYSGTTIWLALSYGGRAEIVAAVNEAIQAGEKLDEESFER